MDVTRLAPSPTGALHLGNARTFLINWLLAQQHGWKTCLRIEDLDGPRIKPGAEESLLDDLRWLGLTWDDGPVCQSDRGALYATAIGQLLTDGVAYPCVCTRKEVERAASAPHAEDGAAVYPGTCRGRFQSIDQARAATGREPAIRFAVPTDDAAMIKWTDRFAGPKQIDVRTLGDFVIAKADGTPAYQLAVVVDDAETGVTQVVRGDDLLDSTPRQILVYRALGRADRVPSYWHLPLVVGTDGRRLAKRHGDSRLSTYRSVGVPAARVLELIARWSGIAATNATAMKHASTAADRVAIFRPDLISKEPVVFTAADDRWLTAFGVDRVP